MHHTDIIDSIGDTPLVELKHCSPKPGVRLFAKLEGTNPTGSVKDRIVKEMVLDAEEAGLLKPGDTIVEASTGNTGIALAMVGRSRGYTVRVVMPENVYPEIPRTLAAYGAIVEQIPAENGVRGAMEIAREMAKREGWLMMATPATRKPIMRRLARRSSTICRRWTSSSRAWAPEAL